jgi:hypothetical protein
VFKPVSIVALTLAFGLAGAAQAQIKAGIPPKPRSVIEAEKRAKAEQAERLAQAGQRSDSHAEAFATADRDADGKVDLTEFKEALLEIETGQRTR